MKSHVHALALTLAIALALGAAGCSHKVSGTFLPNQRPVVRLTWAPIRPPLADSTKADFYIYKMNWVGYDTDGRVVAFDYVIDPPEKANSDTVWIRTPKNEETIYFRASHSDQVDSEHSLGRDQSREFHTFVIRAVDDKGAVSEPLSRAFYSWGVAPEVSISIPQPNGLIHPTVTPAVEITWSGVDYVDEYGLIPEKPVKYKYHLYPVSDIPTYWIPEPDRMRAEVAPTFAGWDSCGGDTTSMVYTNLTPGQAYLFAIVAIGRSGAYSPIFNVNKNLLQMFVGLAGKLGPKITLYNSFFYFEYMSGGFPSPLDPSWAVQLQVPADKPITYNWFATAPEGSRMRRYRWVLDLANLDDETPRQSQNDWYHWSDWLLGTTSATVGPFPGIVPGHPDEVEEHSFYVEAEDINGLVSLGWVWFQVIKPTFADSLLVVDDTRLAADKFVSGRLDTLQRPLGVWPSAAELDTFLYAIGGQRWKMTPSPGNPGNLPVVPSPRGLFQGYPFDTFGTRQGQENPTIPLSTLGKYSHVIWIVDQSSAGLNKPSTDKAQPVTTLRYMCYRNRQNTLSTWVQQGGKLWALGGGFGHATNVDWDNMGNNLNGQVYSNITTPNPDLKAGRFMYDITHWRSEFTVIPKFQPPSNSLARIDQPDPFRADFPTPPNWWLGESLTGGKAIYANLPQYLVVKNATDDPISQWPYRTSYPNTLDLEFLTQDNQILETIGDPAVEYSAMDTMYLVFGKAPAMRNDRLLNHAMDVNPIMTLYRGPTIDAPGADNSQVVFTGFSIWSLRKADCKALIDFVLRDLWHIPYQQPTTLASAHRSTARPATLGPKIMPQRAPVAPQGKQVRPRAITSTWLRRR